MDNYSNNQRKWMARDALPMAILIAVDLMIGGRGTTRLIREVILQKIKKREREEERTDRIRRTEREQNKAREKVFLNTLSRLRRDGLIESNEKGFWGITQFGKKFIKKLLAPKLSPVATEEDKKDADIIFIFDIPEGFRAKRDILRERLINSNFKYFQKSVWIGKGVLSLEFLQFLKDQKIINFVHIFTINKKGTIV
jgi:hypothetical protein